MSSPVRRLRATKAALVRHHPHDADVVREVSRDLAEAKIAAYIRSVVDSAPPLTQDQRSRLADLLRGGAAA